MHPSPNKVLLESLWTEIETLQWVLAGILTLLRRQYSPHKELIAIFRPNYHVKFDSYTLYLTIII
jgi:hypothetical protein